MKIATKIAAGYGILIGLILAVLAYQIALIYQLQASNRNLSNINFRAAIVSLQLLRDLDQVEEFTRKFFATGGDPGYAAQMREMRDAFSQGLQEVRSLRLSAKEEEGIVPLSGLWSQFLRASSRQEQGFQRQDPRQVEAALEDQLTLLSRLRTHTQALIRTTRLAIESQVEESAGAARRAVRISSIAAMAFLAASILVSFWIIHSISKPLVHLTEGTRSVAGGKFFYQLDASGNDELAQLARDFNTMTRRLGELDQLKKDFVSHVSHELKGPLASVRETVRLLLDEIPGPLADQQRRLLELSLKSCTRLASMIGNLLDLARMEAGVMEYEIKKHDLVALIRTALAEFELQVRKEGLRLEAQLPEDPLTVECDGDRIPQIIGNLLENASRFSAHGSTIQVRLGRVPELPANVPAAWRRKVSGPASGEGFALVSVSDSGPGVPADEKEKIFEKFRRLRQTPNQAEKGIKKIAGQGTGLGLAIARTIVEAHRGAIWVEDNPGGGSVFYVLLQTGALTEQAVSPVSPPIR